MEAGEDNSGNSNLKRQRAPLSDSEDNVPASEVNEGQKRRRLEAAGQENRSPKPSTSGRQAELNAKPDTPMLPSVKSRVQQLTQRRDASVVLGGAPLAQRCLSDPGTDGTSDIIHKKGFGEHLLDEGEFNQRKERFKVPVFQASPGPTLSPQPCTRTCSNFVSGIQQKLQSSTTPSTKQASRMRQEREQELSQLQFQSIRENIWLKRSNSDPALTQEGDDGDEMRDGSFIEASIMDTERQASDGTGAKAPCDPVTSAASGKLENCNEAQLPVEWKQSGHQAEEVTGEVEPTALVMNEEKQLMPQVSKLQAVLKLPLSKDESFFRASVGENHSVSEASAGNEHSLLQSTVSEEANMMETSDVAKISGQDVSCGRISFEETKEMDDYSYDEEAIEPSTEEDLKLWRYPQDKVFMEEEGPILAEEQEDTCAHREAGQLESHRVERKEGGSEPSHIQDGPFLLANVPTEMAGSSETKHETPRPEQDELECEKCSDDSVGYWSTLNKDQWSVEEECCEGTVSGDDDMRDDLYPQLKVNQTADKNEEAINVELITRGPHNSAQQAEPPIFTDDTRAQCTVLGSNIKNVAKPEVEDQAGSSHLDGDDGFGCLAEVQVFDHTLEAKDTEKDAVDERQCVVDRLTEQTLKAEGGESSKKVTFILEPELINDSSLSETSTSMESRAVSVSDAELSSQDETNTAEIIDQMFEEVLEYAGRMEEERAEDSGISACSVDKNKIDPESEIDKSAKEEEEEAKKGEHSESEKLESNGDELLTFPPSGILSPLSKSVEAVVTPLRLAVSQESNPPSLLLTPEEAASHPAESAPLYSIDAYRTQNQNKLPTVQSVTPGLQRRAPHKSQPQASVNTKEKIAALNEEAGKLQTVINQTLQALSCCTDEEHGRGSLEEAEAEKLLLVSCEKRSALLAEVARLREERSSTSEGEDMDHVSQQPCRGTVSITNIQLPLKVEFVCSSHNRTGRPSHYFFMLIRYGPCNIVATPLATAADAQNGDTISFPTAITLKDIRSSFEIDVEVYSLSHTSGSSCTIDRTTTKSRVTPRKLLNTITRSSHSVTSAALPALNPRRSSNFCMVGSHKITLASLGHSKFPLDKMKLEGKIRRLLGDEFQEKVPFLSPLEGNVYLRLSSQSHSNVQHQGFLTMFELINGYGVWHRRFFVLEGCKMFYWNHPNDKETKEAEGNISLSSSYSRCVRPVKRDSCARPFTFELVSNVPQEQGDSQEAFAKCWFSADTKQERLDWMEKLNQALLDFHTWKRTSAAGTESQPSSSSSGGKLRESIL